MKIFLRVSFLLGILTFISGLYLLFTEQIPIGLLTVVFGFLLTINPSIMILFFSLAIVFVVVGILEQLFKEIKKRKCNFYF